MAARQPVYIGFLSLDQFTASDLNLALQEEDILAYLRTHKPHITIPGQETNPFFRLEWSDALQFNDGRVTNLYIHMHPGTLEPLKLDGGNAWVTGAHEVQWNVDSNKEIKKICLRYIKERYEDKQYHL